MIPAVSKYTLKSPPTAWLVLADAFIYADDILFMLILDVCFNSFLVSSYPFLVAEFSDDHDNIGFDLAANELPSLFQGKNNGIHTNPGDMC